ncbi:MAG: dUTP diphosphatase [Bacillota bacterium]|nr:dUTP diphosphatase [Bacillota bacterium]
MRVRVKRLSPLLGVTVPEPAYATAGAAGMDLAACLESPLTLGPGERELVPTGLAIELPSRAFVALVFPRSGLAARRGVTLANAVGVVDADYRGEILCPLINLGPDPVTITPGDRIAQVLFVPVATAALEWVEKLSPSVRGDGGFGSTGK